MARLPMPPRWSEGRDRSATTPLEEQVSLHVGPNSTQAFEQFMEVWKQENETRHPVSGVGDKLGQ